MIRNLWDRIVQALREILLRGVKRTVQACFAMLDERDLDNAMKNHFYGVLQRRIQSDPSHPLLHMACEIRDWSGLDVVILVSPPVDKGRVTQFMAFDKCWEGKVERRSVVICAAGAAGMTDRDKPAQLDA